MFALWFDCTDVPGTRPAWLLRVSWLCPGPSWAKGSLDPSSCLASFSATLDVASCPATLDVASVVLDVTSATLGVASDMATLDVAIMVLDVTSATLDVASRGLDVLGTTLDVTSNMATLDVAIMVLDVTGATLDVASEASATAAAREPAYDARKARYLRAPYVDAAVEYAQTTRKSQRMTSLEFEEDTSDSEDGAVNTVTSSRFRVGTVSFKDRIKAFPKFAQPCPDLSWTDYLYGYTRMLR